MDTFKLKFTPLQFDIFKIFCLMSGVRLTKREISTLLNFSPTAVNKALDYLVKLGLLILVKEKNNLHYVSFNRNNGFAKNLKRVENLRMIYESGFADFLHENFIGSSIVLFGSFSLGEDVWFGENDSRNSDIDIAIIGSSKKEVNLKKYEKLFKRKININYYKDWNINKYLKESIYRGIFLYGGVKL